MREKVEDLYDLDKVVFVVSGKLPVSFIVSILRLSTPTSHITRAHRCVITQTKSHLDIQTQRTVANCAQRTVLSPGEAHTHTHTAWRPATCPDGIHVVQILIYVPFT